MSKALLPSELKVGMCVIVLRRANPDDRSGMNNVATIVAVDLPYIMTERDIPGLGRHTFQSNINEVQFGTAPKYHYTGLPTYDKLRKSIGKLLTTTDALESILAGERGKCTIRKISRTLLEAQGSIAEARRLCGD